jgi:hypothetical protein
MNSGGMPMGSGLLPDWLGWICVVMYIVILAVHLSHLVSMSGQHRAWHAGHVLMALGMAWMFLPVTPFPLPALVWQSAFAAAALLVAVWCIWNWIRRQAVSLLWVTLLIGMLAMIYMYTFPGAATQYLTFVLVAYFALEASAWFVGAFERKPEGKERLIPHALGPHASATHALAEAGSLSIRLTLGLMALGMGYMFLVLELAR